MLLDTIERRENRQKLSVLHDGLDEVVLVNHSVFAACELAEKLLHDGTRGGIVFGLVGTQHAQNGLQNKRCTSMTHVSRSYVGHLFDFFARDLVVAVLIVDPEGVLDLRLQIAFRCQNEAAHEFVDV